MKFFAIPPQKLFAWCIAILMFLIALQISAQPAVFTYFAPFNYLHLIVLMIILMLSANEFSLVLLLIAGLLTDTFHQHLLGSSSLMFALLLPFVQLYSQSAVRFSLPQIWGLFAGFFFAYQLGMLIISTLFAQKMWRLFDLLIDSIWTLMLFPIIFAGVLMAFGQRKNNAVTPL